MGKANIAGGAGADRTPVKGSSATGASPFVSLRRRTIHRGKKFDFEVVTVQWPGGRTLEREVVRHPGAVVIVPVLEDGRVVLIRNDRIAAEATLYEFPAGTLEPGEAPEACARRELIEETGYEAATMEPLGWFYTTPGLTDEKMHAFAATGLRQVGQDLEEDERITVEVVSAARAMEMLDKGELVDGKSMLALLLAQRRGLLEGGKRRGGSRGSV
jgi:ADP-ribose pyrophosphatase